MNLHDYLNVRRIFRILAKEWGCPVWMVKRTLRRLIDQNWEEARWEAYFPNGKPTEDQYILRLGKAYEIGEEIPFLLEAYGDTPSSD